MTGRQTDRHGRTVKGEGADSQSVAAMVAARFPMSRSQGAAFEYTSTLLACYWRPAQGPGVSAQNGSWASSLLPPLPPTQLLL